MQRLYYAGTMFVTGDDLAEAVLDYAAALAEHGRVARVSFPVESDEHRAETLSCLIGAGLPIAKAPRARTGPEGSAPADLEDEQIGADLRKAAAGIRSPAPAMISEPLADDWDLRSYLS